MDKLLIEKMPPILDKRLGSIKQYTSNEYAVYMSQAIDFIKFCHIKNLIKNVDISPLLEKKGNFVIIYTKAIDKGIFFDIQFISRFNDESLTNMLLHMLKRNMHRFSKSAFQIVSKIELEISKKQSVLNTDLEKIRILTSEDEALKDIRKLISKAKKLEGPKMLDYYYDATTLITLRKLDALYLFRISTNKNDSRRSLLQRLVMSQKCFKSFKEFSRFLKKTLLIITKESDSIAKESARLFGFLHKNTDIEEDLKKEWFDLSRGAVLDTSYLNLNETEQISESIKKVNIDEYINSIKTEKFKEEIEDIKNNEKLSNLNKHTEFLKTLKTIRSNLKEIKNLTIKVKNEDSLSKEEISNKEKFLSILESKESIFNNMENTIKTTLFDNKSKNPDYPLPPYLERDYYMLQKTVNHAKDANRAKLMLDDFFKDIEKQKIINDYETLKIDNDSGSAILAFITKINGQIKVCTYEDKDFIENLRLNLESQQYDDAILDLWQNADFLKKIKLRLYDNIIDKGIILNGFPDNISEEILSRFKENLLALFVKGDIAAFSLDNYAQILKHCDDETDNNKAYEKLLDLWNKLLAIPDLDTIISDIAGASSISPEENEKRTHFLKKIKEALIEIEKETRRKLRDILPFTEQSKRTDRFKIYGIDVIESNFFTTNYDVLMRDYDNLSSLADINLKIDELAYLEKKVITAQEKCLKDSPVEKNILAQIEKKLLDRKLGEMMLADLQSNLNDLTPLLFKINDDLKKLKELKSRFQSDEDKVESNSHKFSNWEELSETVITINDVNTLKKNYSLIEEVSLEDMKHFASLYKQRSDNIIKWLKENKSIKPEDLAKYNEPGLMEVYDQDIIEKFKNKNIIPVNIKIRIFIQSKQALDEEIQLLLKATEIIDKKAYIHKSFFKNWIKMINYINESSSKELINWTKGVVNNLQTMTKEFESTFWQENFTANSKKLVIESLKSLSSS